MKSKSIEEQESKISSLSKELQVKILSNIPTYDLLQNVSRVSKNFHNLAEVTLAHQYVSLLDNTEKASQFLAANKCIAALNLMSRKKTKPNLEILCDQIINGLFCQNRLFYLNIESRTSVNETSLILLMKNSKIQHMKKLKIRNYHNIDAEETISNWTCYASNLKHLELCCSYAELQNNARSIMTQTLIKIGQASKKLEYIRFEGIISNDEYLGPLFTANKNTLKEVHLPHIKCSNKDILILIKCHQLENLSIWLDGSNIAKQTLLRIPENKLLKSLSIKIDHLVGNNNILSSDVSQLLEHPNLSKLSSLHLSSADIYLSTTEVFKAISSLQDLKYLHFLQNHPETFQKLFEFLKLANKLETLIWNVEIKFNLEEFRKMILMDLPHLKYLEINYVGWWRSWQILQCMQSSNIRTVCFGPSYVYFNKKLSKYSYLLSPMRTCNIEKLCNEYPDVMEELKNVGEFSQPNIFNENFPQQAMNKEFFFFSYWMSWEILFVSICIIFEKLLFEVCIDI